jgi:hypothetical protein
MVYKQDPTQINIMVLKPAGLLLNSRSIPMIAPMMNAAETWAASSK